MSLYIIYAAKETMKVEFEYHPLVDNVEGLMDELIEDVQLNALRKDELVKIFKMKLDEMNGISRIASDNDEDKLDEIEMIFDYPSKLCFKLNGEKYKNIEIGARDRVCHDSYRMGITFNGHPNGIELFDYQQLNA